MAKRARPRNTSYVTRKEFEKLLEVVDKNTVRISRLEDMFALEVRQRAEVRTELELLKRMIPGKP